MTSQVKCLSEIDKWLSKNYTWKYEYKTSGISTDRKVVHVHFDDKIDLEPFFKFISKLKCRVLHAWIGPLGGISVRVKAI